MASVMFYWSKNKKHFEKKLFEGTYEECKEFYDKELVECKKELGDELFFMTFPSSHNSIDACWEHHRLELKNWVRR